MGSRFNGSGSVPGRPRRGTRTHGDARAEGGRAPSGARLAIGVAARRLGWACGVAWLAMAAPAAGGTSRLWGDAGELWDPAGRLPDFSYAGYRAGEAALPEVPGVVSVKDFGAAGDGRSDDTAAFIAAIAAANDGAVLVPAGRYVITARLTIARSRVVLRGEGSGPDGTVLYMPQSLAELYGQTPSWSWAGGFINVDGGESLSLPRLTRVTAPAARADDALAVRSAAGLRAGQLVALRLTDDASGSLGRHLHADQADASSCDTGRRLDLAWPVRILEIEGNVVRLAQPLRTDVRLEWTPELSAVDAIEEVGVEHLAVEFPDVPYAGHLKERGYNAITFHDGVVNGWVRDVRILNADSGVLLSYLIKNVTIREVRAEGRMGHHGIAAMNYTSDILVDRFTLDAPWVHGLTLSERANGVVFSRGQSVAPIALDHHRAGPFENLFTEIPLYSFESGGSGCEGPHAGARHTYWNLGPAMILPPWGAMQTNGIGELCAGDVQTSEEAWYESVSCLEPANLYEGQVAARLCRASFDGHHRGVYDAATAACSQAPRPDGAACAARDPGTIQSERAAKACAANGCSCELAGAGSRSGAGGLLVAVATLGGACARRRRGGRPEVPVLSRPSAPRRGSSRYILEG